MCAAGAYYLSLIDLRLRAEIGRGVGEGRKGGLD